MAETPFPIPRTTVFNPEAWGSTNTISEEEIAFLDNNFVRFPITQPNVTFPVAPTVPTLPLGTGDTRAASAQFVQNAKNTRTWGGLQTFNGGMVTNFVDPTTPGGTLTIGQGAANNNVEVASQINRSTILHLGDGNNSTGGIHIGNGTNTTGNVQILNGTGSTGTITLGSATSTTSLGCPLTPNYSYPVAAGKIGQIVSGTFTTTTTIVVNTPMTQWTISSLPAGTWLMTGSVNRGPNANGYVLIAITTSNNSLSGVLTQDFTNTLLLGNVQTISYVVQVPNSSTPYYIVAQTDTGTTWSQTFGSQNLNFRATRIA